MKIARRAFLAGAAFAAISPMRFLDSSPEIMVRQGKLKGTLEDGLKVYRGIPFAKPPVAGLRFLPPRSPDSWTGVRSAAQQASEAIQADGHGSEDCLYLNMWVPEGEGPFPILIWIHGGGNEGGGTAGQSGASFARLGIITVTVAYRLGTFGCLELGDILGSRYAGSGDNGIRDLEAACDWVHDNARSFGGDPSRITIAGQSAGAKDVTALMALPSHRRKFSRAIMESGSGQTVNTRKQAKEIAELLLTCLGLSAEGADQLLTLSAQEIAAGQRKLDGAYQRNFPFRPSIGTKLFPRRPVDMTDDRTPLLIGTNRDESLAFFPLSDADKPIRSKEVSNIPFAEMEHMEGVYKTAFPEKSNLYRRTMVLTAEEYWMPSIRFAEAHSRRGGKTWMYQFNHTSPHDGGNYALHAAELDYVWNHHPGWSMHETWAGFIKGQDPDWPEYDEATRATLVYEQDGATKVVNDPRGRQRRLWQGNI